MLLIHGLQNKPKPVTFEIEVEKNWRNSLRNNVSGSSVEVQITERDIWKNEIVWACLLWSYPFVHLKSISGWLYKN